MTHKSSLNSRYTLESCTFQLHCWNPFQSQTLLPKTLVEPDLSSTPNGVVVHSNSKRPCLSDCATGFSIDMSKLSLLEDDERTHNRAPHHNKKDNFHWIARKRRRRVSRSVSGRSSDKSGTRQCCSVGGAYATCSDFPVGTDSSGEFFVNNGVGDVSWASDVSEAANNKKHFRRREGNRRDIGSGGERDNLGSGSWQVGVFDSQVANESGYGSEPGYRGDAEFGYGDEFDEEEDDGRILFWGDRFGDADQNMEMVGENTFSEQKAHHRCRRKKHD